MTNFRERTKCGLLLVLVYIFISVLAPCDRSIVAAAFHRIPKFNLLPQQTPSQPKQLHFRNILALSAAAAACRLEWFDICAINTHWHCCSFTLSTHCHELYLSWLVEFVNWKGGIDFTGLYPPNSPDNDIAMHCGTFMHANSNHLTLPHQDQAYKLWMESIGNPVEKCPVPFNTSSGR